MRLKILIFLSFCSLFCSKASFSQTVLPYVFVRVDSVEVKNGSVLLNNAWAGGINYAQFGAIDLNLDGIKDLVVFDRTGNKISTYLNGGTANTVDYKYTTAYKANFPKISNYMLVYDYNCDGKEDFFTYAPGGMACYKNISNATDGLKFEKVSDLIKSTFCSSQNLNLYVSSVDLPALVDMDNDGDMDVLTFSILGSYVEYHENQSKELYGVCDSLIFVQQNKYWGNFYENSSNNTCVLNVPARPCTDLPEGGGIINSPITDDNAKSINHAGSTLFAIDLDADGDKELMLGDVSHTNIVMLTNGGDATTSNITAQIDSFPSNSTKVNIPIFPGSFQLDVNNDGVKDLLFSPNAGNGSENNKSVWYYKNTGTNALPVFEYQQNNFLQNDMIEIGEGAYPNFVDYDADGLLDIAIGSSGYYQSNGSLKSKLAVFKNIGTTIKPKFQLINYDYSNISQHNLVGFYPTFGDLDADGDKDIIAGLSDGSLCYFENTAASGNAANYVLISTSYQAIDVGQSATPQLVDVDRDGMLDLLIGERSGNVNYYRNKGTSTNAVYNLISSTFGEVNVSPFGNIIGYSSPRLFDNAGVYTLFSGSDEGGINRYINIDGNLTNAFDRKDSTYININEGIRSSIDIADITGDGNPEMIIGNYAGGISFYINDPTKVGVKMHKEISNNYSIYPNPTTHSFTLESSNNKNQIIKLYNLLGQEQSIETEPISETKTKVTTTHLLNGIYVFQFQNNGFTVRERIVIQN
ncbi:MAG: T9SS type A sorting domain-containing protein [Bacteroidota bacterium]